MSKARLTQLPTGTWVDPSMIVCVEAFDGGWSGGKLLTPRVVVKLGDGWHHVIDCESREDAEAERDRIAGLAGERAET